MDAFPARHLEVLVCVVKGKCRFSNLVLIKLDLDGVEATVENKLLFRSISRCSLISMIHLEFTFDLLMSLTRV